MNILKGIAKFIPIFILAIMMILGFDILIAAPAALIAAFIIAATPTRAVPGMRTMWR